jgi:SAM-dependent methyltransferase
MKNPEAPGLVPDQLTALWQAVEAKRLTEQQFHRDEKRLLGEYRALWRDALLLDEQRTLETSLLTELGEYVDCDDRAEVRRRCQAAMSGVEREWREKVIPGDRRSIEEYYDKNAVHLYELTWWHTLLEDTSPLAYVTALRFGEQRGCQRVLDFGAGVGSGGILFARHGFNVALADISTTMLDFCEWRFGYKRSLPVHVIDLKYTPLPPRAFDLVTAMDVFEHLVDPVTTMEQVWATLKPGGFLFGRFDDTHDEDHPDDGDSAEHIAQDFGPMFKRMGELGFTEVWHDEWLWGHQAFRKG